MLPAPRNYRRRSFQAQGRKQKVAGQPQIPLDRTSTSSSCWLLLVVLAGRQARLMLQYYWPEKRKQALRGRNLPGISGPSVRQGARASEGHPSSEARLFPCLGHVAMPPKNPGVWGEAPTQTLCRFVLPWLLRPRRTPLPTSGENKRFASNGSLLTPRACSPIASFRITAINTRLPSFGRRPFFA
jgi:hypothetical protein